MHLMRRKKTSRRPFRRSEDDGGKRTLLLALILLLGCLTGSVFGNSRQPPALLNDLPGDGESFFESFLICSKYPLAAFLFGTSYCGAAALPLLCAAKGWTLSVQAEYLFAQDASFGPAQAAVKLCLPAAVSLFCFLLISEDSLKNASRLLSSLRGEHRPAPPHRLAHAALCVTLLLLGTAANTYLTPKFLSLLH